MTKNEDVKFG